MKRIIAVFAVVTVFAACNNKAEEQRLQASRDSIRMIRDSLRTDSLQKVAEIERERRELAEQRAAAADIRNTRVAGYSESGTTQQTTAKKGMSSAAKGALIGAGAGAVTGILVDKKNGRGAIIGGVVGAGTGYVIGRKKDVKSGRVVKKD